MNYIKITENDNKKYGEKSGVITVTLARADVRNAFNPEMIRQITESFEALSQRHDVRVIVLKGEGKVFCAGADLNWMKEMVNFSYDQNVHDSRVLHKMFDVIHKCPHPIVGAVHGAAFGGALGLIACCDVVVAEEKTQFCFSEVKLGIAPAVISEFVLNKIPLAHVAEFMLSAKIFLTSDALRAGLIHYSEEEDNFNGRVDEVVEQFLECGPQAVRATKKLLQHITILKSNKDGLDQISLETTKLIADRRTSAEGQEGLKSFLEKRNPSWKIYAEKKV